MPDDEKTIQIPPIKLTKLVSWIAAILAAAVGFGKLCADVEHLQTDVTSMKKQVNEVYKNLAWPQRGESGPPPPPPDTLK